MKISWNNIENLTEASNQLCLIYISSESKFIIGKCHNGIYWYEFEPKRFYNIANDDRWITLSELITSTDKTSTPMYDFVICECGNTVSFCTCPINAPKDETKL